MVTKGSHGQGHGASSTSKGSSQHSHKGGHKAVAVPSNSNKAVSTKSSANKSSSSSSSQLVQMGKGINKCSTHISKSHKASEFVDKTTARLGFKEEAKYCRTDKYNDKVEGYAHQFQTRLDLKLPIPVPTNKNMTITTTTSCPPSTSAGSGNKKHINN